MFCAGGIATPADAALTMQLGAEGNFVGSGIFKSADPERRARAIVEATTHFDDPERVAAASTGLGEPMRGDDIAELAARASCSSTAGPDACPTRTGGVERTRPPADRRARQPGRFRRPRDACCASSAPTPVEVRTPAGFDDLDALVIPGGESTTITKAIERDGLEAAIRAHVDAGRPMLGTCAGMIVCDREHLGLIDATCAAQRLRAPARELRGRPRDRGHRARAAAGGLHPRALDRESRRRGRGARRASTATRSRSARAACSPAPFTPSSPTTLASMRC